MKNLIIFLTFPMYLFSHFLSENKMIQSTEWSNKTTIGVKSKIVYLFFKVEKTSSGSEKITLQEKKITEGKLKMNAISGNEKSEIGEYIVSLIDGSGKVMSKQVIEDPLNPTREVYGEEISRTQLSLQNAEFNVRYAHQPEIQSVKIEKETKSGKQLIFTQKL